MTLKRLYKPAMNLSIIIAASFAAGSIMGSFETTASALEYVDTELAMKDLEQMKTLVFKIKSQNLHMEDVEEASRIKSKDALVVIFSRRDYDHSISKLIPEATRNLEDDDLMDVYETVVNDSLVAVKNERSTPAQKSTHMMILQNFMGEMRGQTAKYKNLYEKIRDAKIEVTEDVIKYRRAKSTATVSNPSDMASAIVGIKS